jgi:hypothetical protein
LVVPGKRGQGIVGRLRRECYALASCSRADKTDTNVLYSSIATIMYMSVPLTAPDLKAEFGYKMAIRAVHLMRDYIDRYSPH